MKRFSNFAFGLLFGAGLMFVGLKYHIVRANDGLHMVPKTMAKLGSVYSDLRTFTVRDWQDRQELLADITRSNDRQLQEEVARAALGNQLNQALDRSWDQWGGNLP